MLIEASPLSNVNICSLLSLGSICINIAGLKDSKEKGKQKGEEKKRLLERVIAASRDQSKQLASGCAMLLDELSDAFRSLKYRVVRVEMKLKTRGLFGSAEDPGKAAFEVGLYFDPYLNVPVAPGSTIKGAIRATYEMLYPNDEEVGIIFGKSSAKRGAVGACIFTDAYPIEPGVQGLLLHPDVINPHYSVGGEDVVHEHEATPTPIVHICIAPETTFGFLIAIKKEFPVHLTERLMISLLTAARMGIGARTSIGYGRLEIKCLKLVS